MHIIVLAIVLKHILNKSIIIISLSGQMEPQYLYEQRWMIKLTTMSMFWICLDQAPSGDKCKFLKGSFNKATTL